MRKLNISIKIFLLFLSLFSLSISSSSQEQNAYQLKHVREDVYHAIKQFYEYDKEVPFELKTIEEIEADYYTRIKIAFTGIDNSRVVGYLAIPKLENPTYPCVLQMHGLTVSKNDFWEDEYHRAELVTEGLLSSGYAVLAMDMPYHGERIYENDFESTFVTLMEKGWGYRIRNMVVQSTIEYRRAIDYLATRKDIDINRIGAIGYSLGSVVTLNLTGIDERVKTSVVCATAIIKPRPFLPPPEFLSGFAPQTFMKAIGDKPILILAANNDDFNCTVEEAEQLYSLIESENKQLIFYDSGHKLPPDHATAAINWFVDYLK